MKKQDKKKYTNGGIYSIYGARESKSGYRYNISLIRDNNGKREFATISLPKDKVTTKDDFIYIKVKLLVKNTKEEKKEDNDLPF